MKKLSVLFATAALACAPAAPRRSVLVVFAHPDDETVIGALLAKLAAEGYAVHLISMTSGQKGATPNTKLTGDELGAVREAELRCSTQALGIPEPLLWRYQDQGISAPPVIEQLAQKVRDTIAQFKPDVILTWGPDGLTGHPDHRMASNIATQVFQQRGLLAYKPRKLYYVAFPESLFPNTPGARRRPFRTMADAFVTTEVDTREFLKPLFAAQHCHQTQWGREQIAEKEEMFSKTLGGRTFLRLALSDAPRGAARESDIFAGL